MRAVEPLTNTFWQQVDDWVADAIRIGARDLEALIAALPGVYPVEVVNSVHRLSQRAIISERLKLTLIQSAYFVPGLRAPTYRCSLGLPVPHPLDYDWRFTERTAIELLRICRNLGESMICLGTPTIFVAAAREGAFNDVTLIDRNSAMIDHIASLSLADAIRLDLLTDEIPKIQADVILTDPPWYREHMEAFLWAATQLCPVGGHVAISLPPHGTRPEVQEELSSVRAWAERLGFAIHWQADDMLTYETPPFERNALRAVGIGLSSSDWRKGTLCILRKMAETNALRPRVVSAPGRWSEASLFGSRFFFRQSCPTRFDDPSLSPLVPGDILPSVSRRHRLRECADVWSSGNRVFRCQAPGVLKLIVEALADVRDPGEVLAADLGIDDRESRALVEKAARTMHDLAAIERDERGCIDDG